MGTLPLTTMQVTYNLGVEFYDFLLFYLAVGVDPHGFEMSFTYEVYGLSSLVGLRAIWFIMRWNIQN